MLAFPSLVPMSCSWWCLQMVPRINQSADGVRAATRNGRVRGLLGTWQPKSGRGLRHLLSQQARPDPPLQDQCHLRGLLHWRPTVLFSRWHDWLLCQLFVHSGKWEIGSACPATEGICYDPFVLICGCIADFYVLLLFVHLPVFNFLLFLLYTESTVFRFLTTPQFSGLLAGFGTEMLTTLTERAILVLRQKFAKHEVGFLVKPLSFCSIEGKKAVA